MVNVSMISGVIVSEIKERELPSGNKTLYFTLCNRRNYREGGRYKENYIYCECARPSSMDYMLKYFEQGCKITVFGEVKVNRYYIQGKWIAKWYINVSNVYPVTFKGTKALDDEDKQQNDDDFADCAQVGQWGDEF